MKRLILLFVSLFPLLSAAQTPDSDRWAVVGLSANFMREKPAYEAENGDQSLMGTVVRIISEQGYWRQIVTPEPYTAWVNEKGLVEMNPEEIKAYIAAPKYICTADYDHIFAEPDENSVRISDFILGDIVRKGIDARGKEVKKGRFSRCILPSDRIGWILTSSLKDLKEMSMISPDADAIINTAYRFLGVPYMWGGTCIKSVDCSGLVSSVFFNNGILLPRNASAQARTGVEVDPAALEKGDLLCFGNNGRVSHIGIYMGGGLYIHSSQYVRISSLEKGNDLYEERTLITARRVIPEAGHGNGVELLNKNPLYFSTGQ